MRKDDARPLARATARRESGLFECALKRMLILVREIHDLVHFGFGNFIRENPANADALLMDMKHDPSGLLEIHMEKALEDDDDEFHWSVIVIQHQNFEHTGFFGACAGLGRNPDLIIAITVSAARTFRRIVIAGADDLFEPHIESRHCVPTCGRALGGAGDG